MYRNKHTIYNDKGFTLVELIVVLALMTIVLGVTLFGGLAWQDYSRFNHEEAVAEDIFFAAQNQLTEYDASGAMEGRVQSLLWKPGTKDYVSGTDGYVLATANNTDLLHSIIYKNGSSDDNTIKYKWDDIWKEYLKGDKNTVHNQKAAIIRLNAKKGDYDKYLIERAGKTHEGVTLSAGTTLLFDIVSPYLADTSVLNGCIALEFSPEAGQVFSVCYSDVANEFEYSDSTSGGVVGIIDRRIQTRKDHMVGYYSVDQLYEKLKGKEKVENKLRLEIRSREVLEMVVHDETGEILNKTNSQPIVFSLFNGDPNAGEASVLDFSLTYNYEEYKAMTVADGIDKAVADPQIVKTNASDDENYVVFNSGKFSSDTDAYQCRFPVWIDSTSGDMHIILDAADIQAESYAYYKAMIAENGTTEEKQAFLNTFSFYRFGLSENMHYVYAKVVAPNGSSSFSMRNVGVSPENPDGFAYHKDIAEENGPIGECIAFDSYAKDSEDINKRLINIKNGRNLFNMRYETDYKSNSEVKNEFKLIEDIDWNIFVDKADTNNPNYFLNSYDEFAESGINYGVGDTSNVPFPGFRCLSKGDSFVQENALDPDDTSKENYIISNLTISITDNIRYGVYDSVFYDPLYSAEDKQKYADIKKHCMNDDFTGILGADGLSRRGMLPLGLFAENLGTIQNITLDKHIVRGMEVLRNDADKNIIYTCMVGGFTGNNIGDVSGLTLLDTASADSNDKNTHINGRTDVGGILGRQSFSVSQDKDVELNDLNNNGEVTGYENVGGIVGRVYVHYINDLNNTSQIDPGKWASDERKKLYHDGYDITDSYKSMSGVDIFRTKTVSVKDCNNTGHVSGDAMIYNTAYRFEGKAIEGDLFLHCAFIGGIAGITQDGFIIDDNNTNNAVEAFKYYENQGYYHGESIQYVKVENCNSETLYPWREVLSDSKKALFKGGDSGCRDCYVGGLIGYARLTNIIECNNDNTVDADFSGDDIPFVIGQNYVGGLIGCSDESRIVLADKSGSTYSAINRNLVIGERYVGGIAGAFGIGDITPRSLSFKNPASNEASQATAVMRGTNDSDLQKLTPHGKDRKRNRFINRLCNKGIVLGVRNTRELNYIKEEYDKDRFSGIQNPDAGSGMIGGIAGVSLDPIEACDNIQSKTTKDYLLELVGITESDLGSAETVAQKIEDSSFGGTCVGGIVGSVLRYGFINRESYDGINKSNSMIDAVVFGQDYVGGAIGMVDDLYTNPYNLYPTISNSNGSEIDGMVVLGRDVVGGIAGYVTKKLDNHINNKGDSDCSFYNTDYISTPYKVYGRYAVGGYIGIAKHNNVAGNQYVTANIAISDGNKISVNGIAYTGGFVGICESTFKAYYADISGISVNGKFFTGGCFGALDTIKTDGNGYFASANHILNTVKNEKPKDKITNFIIVKDTSVKSTIFGGSVVGLYSIAGSGKHFSSTDEHNAPNGNLYNVAESLKTETGDDYKDASSAFDAIVNNDIANGVFSQDKQNSYTTDMGTNDNSKSFKSAISVESELFAGGFFGYIPDGTKLTFKNFVNNANLKVTGSIGASSVNEMKSEDDLNSDKFAYLGGVIGRIPRGMTVENCNNEVITPSDNYKASEATYLGGLTEVNAGKILNCENKTNYNYGSGGVGAFAGVNGTNVTSILYSGSGKDVVITKGDSDRYLNSNGLIAGCKNTGNISSSSGFAGGIAAANRTSNNTNVTRNSAITNCVNLGEISGDDVAGIVPKASGKDIITYCRNYGNLSGISKSYGIAGASVGDITKNLEVGNRSVVNKGDPVAPMAPDNLTNNFYISGYTSDYTGSGSSTPADITNTGNVYFNVNSSIESMNQIYNRTETSYPVAVNMGLYDRTFSVTYNAMSDDTGSAMARGVKMKEFYLVFGNKNWLSGQTYGFEYYFTYKNSSGELVQTDPVFTTVKQDTNVETCKLVPPKNVDIYSVTLNFIYNDEVAAANNNGYIEVQYCCAYFTDIKGKHYIHDAENEEDLSVSEEDKNRIYFSAYRLDGMDVRLDLAKGDVRNEFNLFENKTIYPFDRSTYSVRDFSENSTNKKYDVHIVVDSPLDGLDANYIRLYWLYSDATNGKAYDYMVALSYLDENGDEQTVYRYRKFSFPEVTSDSITWIPFYDDIPVTTLEGSSIKPTKIELLMNYMDKDGNSKSDMAIQWYFGGVTWFDKNNYERYIVDSDNPINVSDTSGSSFAPYVDGLIDGSTYMVESDEKDWETDINSDHWSKQLLVNDKGQATFNLAYARNGVIKENLTTGMYADFIYDPNDTNVNASTRFNTFDSWFMDGFIDNLDYFEEGKESIFVDP